SSQALLNLSASAKRRLTMASRVRRSRFRAGRYVLDMLSGLQPWCAFAGSQWLVHYFSPNEGLEQKVKCSWRFKIQVCDAKCGACESSGGCLGAIFESAATAPTSGPGADASVFIGVLGQAQVCFRV